MLPCPCCHGPMRAVDRSVEVNLCNGCGGFYVDSATLNRLEAIASKNEKKGKPRPRRPNKPTSEAEQGTGPGIAGDFAGQIVAEGALDLLLALISP